MLGHRVWDYLRSELGNQNDQGQIQPAQHAVDYLHAYLVGVGECSNCTWPAIGRRFDELTDTPLVPNRITATDLVAISFLSVNVPPRATWAILREINDQLEQHWNQVPTEVSIESPDCGQEIYSSTGELQEIWKLLRRDSQDNLWGMGPTTISKVMARKRPKLVPIQDRVVMQELQAKDASYWDMWWQAMHLRIDNQTVVLDFARSLQAQVPANSELSLLRILDIVIWMRGKAKRAQCSCGLPKL